MPADTASLSLYRIDRCGYYERSSENPIACNVACAMSDLTMWLQGKRLEDTLLFEPGDESGKTYCLKHVSQGSGTQKTYLLTLWAHASASGSRIAYVKGSSIVGQVAVSESQLDEDAIPGIPHYFWFLPERRLVVTVRVPGQTAGKAHMERFMRAFLAGWTNHLVKDDAVGERTVTIRAAADEIISGIYPQFRASFIPDPSVVQFLLENRELIRHLVISHDLETGVAHDRQIATKVLEVVGLEAPSALSDTVSIKYRIGYRPTRPELERMIQEAMTGEPDSHGMGFQLEGDPRTYRLRNTQLRLAAESITATQENGVYEASSLLAWLNHHKRPEVETRSG